MIRARSGSTASTSRVSRSVTVGRSASRSEEHTSELQSRLHLVCRLLLEKKNRTDLGLIPPERRRTPGQYFLEYVHQTLAAKNGADMVLKGCLNIYPTLNPTMQLTAAQAL